MEAAARDAPVVGLIMGSTSDWKTMGRAAETLEGLGIRFEKKVVSAHRTPDDLFKYAATAEERGLKLIIAGAGGAAHLPGMTASKTIVPVIGVPVETTPLNGLDALLSIMQMPAEVGVATVGVGPQGAMNAAILAAMILGRGDEELFTKLRARRRDMGELVSAATSAAARASRQQITILIEEDADTEMMQHAATQFSKLDMLYKFQKVEPAAPVDELARCTRTAEEDGTVAFIAGSGRGIEFACKIASMTMLPVLGVPLVSKKIECVESYLKPFLEMPSGVATFAINRAGAINAALFAATILSAPGTRVWERLKEMRLEQAERVRAMTLP